MHWFFIKKEFNVLVVTTLLLCYNSYMEHKNERKKRCWPKKCFKKTYISLSSNLIVMLRASSWSQTGYSTFLSKTVINEKHQHQLQWPNWNDFWTSWLLSSWLICKLQLFAPIVYLFICKPINYFGKHTQSCLNVNRRDA